ncbi:bifunctional hydroxymethylpyrimidine kinase/phosphomethylpyrimidine kinase [Microbacterium barkeri]|uniref:bifunctional hydroxymethylpyrimidine kinase/phosphomethylpyrimidine kinase n=1 Tax=Microbacterium barkeri TaxID=33917 RepID=UPI0024AE8D8C|nr:bifunctional hydroxymethylpyrimidine kinase/phosphomethylpyrimidine kinase [Microbacterium barkeri]MDI6943977.1 bifunctional hydroxymethylpyrimidine kinase/phosphomethylpyrimidine kinase [Microbacterium barkeri]
MTAVPNILAIAGSDPSGGAGIQADLKSIAACGGYGMAAITALTAQSTQGVSGVHVPPASFLREQLDALAADIRIDAVKIGMLGTAEIVAVVANWLRGLDTRPPVVLDPVMIATSGDRLIDVEAERALHDLLSLADVVTPNLPELAVLTGVAAIGSWTDALAQAAALARRHGVLVLAKGGHLDGPACPDALVGPDGLIAEFSDARIETTATHGTGCSLSAALATLRAREGDWTWAARLARGWLRDAIASGSELEVGRPGGHGPLHHLAGLWRTGGLPRRDAELDAWWEDIAPLRAGIDDVWFVRALADGSLDRDDFAHYLAQDSLYLRTYARVLSRAAELAPTLEEQAFWAASAHSCLETELSLHRARLDDAPADAPATPSAETTAYLDHLQATAAAGDHAVLVAAVLPCFWLYQDIGARLAAANRPGHPYADWLEMYASDAFDLATREAIRWTQEHATAADDARLARMRTAFDVSARHELAFFAQRRDAVAREQSRAGAVAG